MKKTQFLSAFILETAMPTIRTNIHNTVHSCNIAYQRSNTMHNIDLIFYYCHACTVTPKRNDETPTCSPSFWNSVLVCLCLPAALSFQSFCLSVFWPRLSVTAGLSSCGGPPLWIVLWPPGVCEPSSQCLSWPQRTLSRASSGPAAQLSCKCCTQ